MNWPAGVPSEMGLLVAGHLQSGEAINSRNFSNYLHRKNLRFLPFVITPTHFRFFVFMPTDERVLAAVEAFKKITASNEFRRMRVEFELFLRRSYAKVRLDEAEQIAPGYFEVTCKPVRTLTSFADWSWNNPFSFVYKDLPGPQSVTVFTPDMFSK